MKCPFFILLMSILCGSVTAQKDVPAYGKIDKGDLEMKNCAFDDAAEAMVLFDVGEVYGNLNLNSTTNSILRTEFARHVRIKILTDKGLSQANVKIRYYSDHNLEDIKNISAQTINLDASGNIVYTKVEKSLIYRKKLNKRYSEVIFAFPEVRKGSIIEYKFVDDADGFTALKNWYFQSSIPVRLSRYTMNFPKELFVTATQKGAFNTVKLEEKEDYRNVKTYTMKDIPALRDEAYITCDEDYMQQVLPLLQAVDFPGQPSKSMLRTWPGIIKELMEDEDFGIQLKRNIPRTSDLDILLEKITDPYKKMLIIHDYVRKNMQWNEFLGIWALDGVKAAWKDKKGTSGEINLILVNLLKDADINVHPVLVSTRENGRVNTGLPGIAQFDKVMAYVEINSKTYVLDATDKYTPANLIPYDVLYSEGRVIEKLSTFEWGWKTLWNEKKTFTNLTALNVDIDDKGVMKGNANISSSEYSRLQRMPDLKKGKQHFIETFFTTKNAAFTVDSLYFENEETDTLPLKQNLSFTGKTSSSGDYHYFSANLFSGLEKNPFIADDRFSDIFFGANQKNIITGRFSIPPGYQFDELPKNIKMRTPDSSIIFTRLMQVNENEISLRIQLDINKPMYPVDEYPYFKEFYKRLFEMLNEQIVFKKK